ncbi:MAG: efflux RND transporter periplasmic adaptor subunit [Bacteroidia bacterium]
MRLISLLTILLLLSACGSEQEKKAETISAQQSMSAILTPAQIKTAGIVSGGIEHRNISSLLHVNGVIDVPPQNMIAVTFPPGGYLKSTKLLPGMHIRKGEELAVLEDPGLIRLQQEYLTALINGRQLEAEYRRQQELNQSKTSSDKQFQEAESLWRKNQVSIRSLSEQLQLAGINPDQLNENNISRSVTLRSPIDGYVTTVKVNIGTFVNPSDILFELVDPRDIHLNMTVFEKDIRYLAIGQKVLAWTNSEPESKHKCEIILVGKELDEHRSVEVHCHFEDYDKELLPGMFMNASIQVNQQQVTAVPEEAIVTWQNKSWVFEEQHGNVYTMIPVRTGMKESGYIEVQPEEGKMLPERIAIKGAYTLLMQLMNKSEE